MRAAQPDNYHPGSLENLCTLCSYLKQQDQNVQIPKCTCLLTFGKCSSTLRLVETVSRTQIYSGLPLMDTCQSLVSLTNHYHAWKNEKKQHIQEDLWLDSLGGKSHVSNICLLDWVKWSCVSIWVVSSLFCSVSKEIFVFGSSFFVANSLCSFIILKNMFLICVAFQSSLFKFLRVF